jgi:hypothetical protein
MKVKAKDVLKEVTAQGRTVKFIVYAVEWYNRGVGSYFSVRIVRLADGAQLPVKTWKRGYGDFYKQMALEAMSEEGWLPEKYSGKNAYMYERENNYPIEWELRKGTKREMLYNIGE